MIYGDFGTDLVKINGTLDVAGDNIGSTSLQLLSGNTSASTASSQILFGYNGTTKYRHAIKTRHNPAGASGNTIDFYGWDWGNQGEDEIGNVHILTLDANGGSARVGIGSVTSPQYTLDVGGSVRTTGTLQVGDFTLPNTDGSTDQVLTTDGSGTVSWGDKTAIIAANGLTNNAGTIEFGGLLDQATTITLGLNTLNFNMNSIGDFNIQDNGTTTFQMRDDGAGFFGGDIYFRGGSVGGTNLMLLSDDADDGRLRIYENGVPSVDLDANTQFLFNAQGLDRDFRVESDDETHMLFVNAATNRVGIGESLPLSALHVTDSYVSYVARIENTFGGSANVAPGLLIQAGNNNGTGSSSLIRFRRPDGTTIGGINQNSSTTVGYFTSSDVRLKENIRPTRFSLNDLMKINVADYNFISDGDKSLSTGFIAQELYDIYPEVVTVGGEDAKTNPWSVDYGKITPLLVKAIQDQQQLIEKQQSQIDQQAARIEVLANNNSEMDKLKTRLAKIEAELSQRHEVGAAVSKED